MIGQNIVRETSSTGLRDGCGGSGGFGLLAAIDVTVSLDNALDKLIDSLRSYVERPRYVRLPLPLCQHGENPLAPLTLLLCH
jgi:hypothetical protein